MVWAVLCVWAPPTLTLTHTHTHTHTDTHPTQFQTYFCVPLSSLALACPPLCSHRVSSRHTTHTSRSKKKVAVEGCWSAAAVCVFVPFLFCFVLACVDGVVCLVDIVSLDFVVSIVCWVGEFELEVLSGFSTLVQKSACRRRNVRVQRKS